MYRLLVILALAHSALAVTEPTLEEILNQIFGVEANPADIDNSLAKPQNCDSVVGSGGGCYECRYCNDTVLQSSRYQPNSIEVLLKNAQCTAEVKVCCVSQNDFLNQFRASDKCGLPNPEGIPRRRRTFVRSVLQAEFPWRAWVYSKSASEPLCAATFIHEEKRALLTLASCIHGRDAKNLEVAFMRKGGHAAVSNVIVHENYRPGSESNNIAILQLESLEATPKWTSPACLPYAAPPLVTPCIVTTVTDLRIDSVIPVRTACTLDNSTLPESLTCGLAPPGDYEPEAAAGLYCLDQQMSPPAYTVHGIFTTENQNIASYVNIWHLLPWLKNKLDLKD